MSLFAYDFMLRALVVGVVIACVAPLMGTFLVVRRYSYLADTLAHVSLVGVAVGLLTSLNPILTALAVTVLSGLAIEQLRATRRFFSETILAVFLSGSLALALLLIKLAGRFNQDLMSFLFGSITTVAPLEVRYIIALGVLTALAVWLFYKEFFLVSLHEDLARAEGVPVRFINAGLVLLAALTVAISMRVVGVLLIGALMVIPVMVALQFGRSFRATIGLAILTSLLATLLGLAASFYLDLPTGPSIVAVTLLFLIGAVIFSKKNSL